MDTDENLHLIRTYFDALLGKNTKRILDMLDEHVEWFTVPTGEAVKGKAALLQVPPTDWSASPNRSKTLINVFAGEESAFLEYRTTRGQASDRDPRHELLRCLVFHVMNGKIDRVHEYFQPEAPIARVERRVNAG
jgi:ketosteroid isomerase-like protein